MAWGFCRFVTFACSLLVSPRDVCLFFPLCNFFDTHTFQLNEGVFMECLSRLLSRVMPKRMSVRDMEKSVVNIWFDFGDHFLTLVIIAT